MGVTEKVERVVGMEEDAASRREGLVAAVGEWIVLQRVVVRSVRDVEVRMKRDMRGALLPLYLRALGH